MLNWLTGGGPAPEPEQNKVEEAQTPQPDNYEGIPSSISGILLPIVSVKLITCLEYDETNVPQTPAAMFAVKAFRTAIFGTPAPKAPRLRHALQKTNDPPAPEITVLADKKPEPVNPRTREPQREKPEAEEKPTVRQRENRKGEGTAGSRAARRQRALFRGDEHKENDVAGSKPFTLLPHPNIFDPKGASKPTDLPAYLTQGTPARPPSPTKGILVTPGVSMGRRKAVTFDSATKKDEGKLGNTRTRSGLPKDFPGKFPSPWTPKSGTPRPTGSLEETSLPIESAAIKKRAVKLEVTETSRIGDILMESDDDEKMPVFQDGELTTDMNAPKSASGKYWKDHAENLEGLALSKVDWLRDRCSLAIEYAKRKDKFCVDLSEKLRELMDKNKLLKNEIKRLNQFSDPSDGNALSDAMLMLKEKEARISQNEQEKAQMQSEYATQLQELQKMLDQREQNIAELSMNMFDDAAPEQVAELKQKLRHARQEVKELGLLRAEHRSCKSRVNALEKEKENLEAQLERMKSVGDESYAGTGASERRLRSRIDELEKEKRDMRVEMRAKVAEASKERREGEKSLRSEIAELKAKVKHGELDKKELAREMSDYIHSLERDLIKATSDKTALRYATSDNRPDELQRKLRETVQEPHRAKEDIAAGQNDDQAPLRLGSRSSPLKPITNTTESKEPKASRIEPGPSANDDLAIDRNYDRGPTPAASRASNRSPRKPPAPVFSLPATSGPHEDTANSSLFLHLPKKMATEFAQAPRNDENKVPEPDRGYIAMDFEGESFTTTKRTKPSPRPSMVNFEISPGPAKRRAHAVGRKSLASRAGKSGVFLDPERHAAAERRIAERKAKRTAERLAAKVGVQ